MQVVEDLRLAVVLLHRCDGCLVGARFSDEALAFVRARKICASFVERVLVSHEADRRLGVSHRAIDQIRCDLRIGALQVRIPAVSLLRALVIENVQRLAEDSHIAHDRQQHAVLEVNFGSFPQGKLESVERIRQVGRALEFQKIHGLEFPVEGSELARPVRPADVGRRRHRASRFIYILAVFASDFVLHNAPPELPLCGNYL